MNYVTQENFESFNNLYEKAVREKKESFEFEGQEILTAYAKYVIEFLTTKTK